METLTKTENTNKLIAEFMGFQKPEIGQLWDYSRHLCQSDHTINLKIIDIVETVYGTGVVFDKKMAYKSYGIEYFDGKVFWPTGMNWKDHAPVRPYDTNWNWLMPVIEKIKTIVVDRRHVIFTIGSEGIYIKLNESNAFESGFKPCVIADTLNINYFKNDPADNTPFIEAVYKGVVTFIKWYNKKMKIS